MKSRDYRAGDSLDIHVGQMWSDVIGSPPYDFYSLNWCDSTKGHSFDPSIIPEKKFFAESNDSVNSWTHESPYTYKLGEDVSSQIVCNRVMTRGEMTPWKNLIKYRYKYQLFVDDLPNATMEKNPESGELETNYAEGLYVGKHY